MLLAALAVWFVIGINDASTLSAIDLNPNGPGDQRVSVLSNIPSPVYPPRAEVGKVSGVDSDSWTTVDLTYSYDSMVVVATPSYGSGDPPLVTRIQNASGDSFEIRFNRADGNAANFTTDAHYMVIEEGVYDVATNGLKLEAVRYTSTVTDRKSSWVGESRSYSNSYTSPVIVGQVMTYADSDFFAFWAKGSSTNSPPSASTLVTGKHVAEDTDTTRSDETIGYVVFESGSGSIGDLAFYAELGADIVRGTGNSPPYNYSFPIFNTVVAAVGSSAGMDANDGGWPVLYGTTPLSTSSVDLVYQEDTINDTETRHGTEQVAYVVFGT